METKVCPKCKIEKHKSEFHLKKKGEIKLAYCCKKCKQEIDNEYRLKNVDNLKIVKKNYYINNKEILNKKGKIYYLKNKSETDEYRKNYRMDAKNKQRKKELNRIYKLNNREKLNTLERKRNKTNALYKLKNTIRKSILKKIKQEGFIKNDNTTNILGCSYQELKQYLESKFESWMNWDNHGKYNGTLNYGWDIDHIIPMNSAKTEEDVIRLNHYTNLQPLCSKVNRDIKWKK